MAFKKYAKKLVRKGVRAVKKRYTTKKGGIRLGSIAKDVMMLKNVLNPELKEFRIYNNPANDDAIDIGQVAGNSPGYNVIDVSCAPNQGTTSITRNGNSIRNSSLECRFSVFQQANTIQDIKGKILFICPKIPEPDFAAAMNKWFEPTPFLNVDVRDYNSHFDKDYRNQFKILHTKYFTLKNDNTTTQEQHLSFATTIRFKNFHTKFPVDGGTTISSGQILMVILLDSGNSANSTTSTIKNIVPSDGGVQTGLTFNYNLLHKFYDN